MGTDIHMAVEVRQAGTWRWLKDAVSCSDCDGKKEVKWKRDEKAYPCFCVENRYRGTQPGRSHGYKDRNYDAFGVIADVRNGTWGDETPFIDQPRGLPADLSAELRASHDDDSDEGEAYGLGDHSFSHLTLAELLAFNWDDRTQHRAIVDWDVFAKWDRKSPPPSYCAGVGGKVIEAARASLIVDLDATPNGPKPYVKVEWRQTLADTVGNFHSKFIPELVAIAEREGVTTDDVRIVFGFDS